LAPIKFGAVVVEIRTGGKVAEAVIADTRKSVRRIKSFFTKYLLEID
jgi:hypothetical protein